MKRYLAIGVLLITVAVATGAAEISTKSDSNSDAPFAGPIPRLQIEIPPDGMKVLRDYKQVWRQKRPERIDVRVTVREGSRTYTNVALHLKGSYSFLPIDEKPSLTLNFDKFARGQLFHGLDKIHLNNSVQDQSYLCETFARDLFLSLGVPSPRATPALVSINGRDTALYVLVEGANKRFVKRHFASADGNLYDGGSGGDVTKALETDSGKNPDDRSDLKNLVKAARTEEPVDRLAQLNRVLDVERFITFAAVEDYIVHWDGYAIGCNNYRLFHDTAQGKMVFIPHGLDQLFGVSRPVTFSLTPPFKGMVAQALFSVPEARQRYLERIGQLATNELKTDAMHARIDKLAERVRHSLNDHRGLRSEFDDAVNGLKSRMIQRAASVARQLKNPPGPAPLAADNSVRLDSWGFKAGSTRTANGRSTTVDGRQFLSVTTRGPESSGAWRTTVLLDSGHYEFTGMGRTEKLPPATPGTNGVLLRISGERSTEGITTSAEWTALRYEFDVRGIMDVELICEYRGPEGTGTFDRPTLRLVRKGPPSNREVEVE